VLRNKFLFGGIGIIAILLVASLAGVTASLGRERQARRKRKTEEARSRPSHSILKDMLQGVGPSVARGARYRHVAREFWIERRNVSAATSANNPPWRRKCAGLIGRLYLEIGNYDGAEKMHRAALTLYRKLFGPEKSGGSCVP